MSTEIEDHVAAAQAAQAGPAHPSVAPLLDANGAAALLTVPATWVLAEARADRIPHVRLGAMSGSTQRSCRCGGRRGAAGRGAQAGPQPRWRAAGKIRNDRKELRLTTGAGVAWSAVPARRSYGSGSLYVRTDR